MAVTSSKRILVIAGEPSGDLHGARVLRELKKLLPGARIFGIGGEGMRKVGQEQFYTTHEMAIMGFTEVVKHLPFIWRVMRHLQAEVRARKPDLAILIDYPGFNLRLARRLRRQGVPILYYIAPQVWAWGARRIGKMAKLIDHLAVVFPFEADLFSQRGLPTTFVGHPLLETLQAEYSRAAFRELMQPPAAAKRLGLLPGSRRKEVQRLLPDMLAAASLLRKTLPELQCAVAKSPVVPAETYHEIFTGAATENIRLVQDATYSVMAYSDACLVASGTATLETALFGTPMVVVYRVSRPTYEIARRLIKLRHIAMPNIIAGEEVVPELIQHVFTANAAAAALLPVLENGAVRAAVTNKLNKVSAQLGEKGASRRVAEIAAELLCRKNH